MLLACTPAAAAVADIPQGRDGSLDSVAAGAQRRRVPGQPTQQRTQLAFAQLGSARDHIRGRQAACSVRFQQGQCS